MALDLFGFTIGRKSKGEAVTAIPEGEQSAVVPDEYDGSYTFETGGILGTYVDFSGAVKSENALIQQYRGIALFPEVDNAVEDICNEAIVMGTDRKPIKLGLHKVQLSDTIKNKMYNEFDYVLRLLDFHKKSYEIFRRWYVDSKLFYQIVINDKDPLKGIRELRPVDPTKIKRVRKVIKEKSTVGANKSAPMVQGIEEKFNESLDIFKKQFVQSTCSVKSKMLLWFTEFPEPPNVEFSILMWAIFPNRKLNNICVRSCRDIEQR